jgi:hypothetical protein
MSALQDNNSVGKTSAAPARADGITNRAGSPWRMRVVDGETERTSGFPSRLAAPGREAGAGGSRRARQGNISR